jgi:hypothetical protein
MSETRTQDASGLLDETGKKISKDVEPLVQYMKDHPVCTALAALGLGYILAKIL